jgi:hypothetical protein
VGSAIGSFCELRELLAGEQHDEGVLADEHAGGGLVGEPSW